jgi:hypothetical protein
MDWFAAADSGVFIRTSAAATVQESMSVLTFEQFLRNTAAEGEAINPLFEEPLFDMVGVLALILSS